MRNMGQTNLLNSDLGSLKGKRYLLLTGTNQAGIKMYVNTRNDGFVDLCFSYRGRFFGSLVFDSIDKQYVPGNPTSYD